MLFVFLERVVLLSINTGITEQIRGEVAVARARAEHGEVGADLRMIVEMVLATGLHSSFDGNGLLHEIGRELRLGGEGAGFLILGRRIPARPRGGGEQLDEGGVEFGRRQALEAYEQLGLIGARGDAERGDGGEACVGIHDGKGIGRHGLIAGKERVEGCLALDGIELGTAHAGDGITGGAAKARGCLVRCSAVLTLTLLSPYSYDAWADDTQPMEGEVVMRNIRWIGGLSLVLVTPLLSGCVIQFDLLGNQGTSREDEPAALPAPRPPSGDMPAPSENEPVLDEGQQTRKDEVDKYIREVMYHGATIVDSVMLPSGDVVDFLDRDTLPAVPEPSELPLGLENLPLPPDVELGLSELEQIPELVALAATMTPFHRPTFWPYILGETDATSIEDYLDQYTIGGAPGGSEHLHTGFAVQTPNRGVSGFMNQFRPQVEDGTFSLMEFAVACPANGPVQELIGGVISIDKVNAFGMNKQALTDSAPRLHVEFAVPDPITGKTRYLWDEVGGHFQPNKLRIRHRVGETVPVSTLGGTQVEHLIAIWQDLVGDWYIAYQGEILGHYPANKFKLLSAGACQTQWYGEVARRTPASPTPWPKTEMGSGKFPEAGASNAAYVRNPIFFDSLLLLHLAESVPSLVPILGKDSCYKHSTIMAGTLPGDRLFYLGGPGGNDPACVWP